MVYLWPSLGVDVVLLEGSVDPLLRCVWVAVGEPG